MTSLGEWTVEYSQMKYYDTIKANELNVGDRH